MYTKSSYTNFIGGFVFSLFAYSKKTGTRILFFRIPVHVFRRTFVENLITVKRSLRIGVNSSGSRKVFLCTYIKASINRQGLGILKCFFFAFLFK